MSDFKSNVIRHVEGRPVILHNGRPVSQAGYCDYFVWGDWKDRIRQFIDSGVKVFFIKPHRWKEDAPLWGMDPADQKSPRQDIYTMLEQADFILKHQPDALFQIRTNTMPPPHWLRTYTDDVQTDEDGVRYCDASISSPRYLQDMAAFFHRVVEYCESQPWGERIVGYLDAGPGEGTLILTLGGKMFDCSPVNDLAFNDWIRSRYSGEAELQKAWADPAATFENVRVPRDKEWYARQASTVPTLGGKPVGIQSMVEAEHAATKGLFHWIERANAPRELDYCHFIRDMFLRKWRTIYGSLADACEKAGVDRITGCDVTKQPLMGWPILSSFDGTGDGTSFPNVLQLSGSWNVGELLDDEAVPAIFTPADYTARTVGYAYDSEGLTDSLILRSKAMIVENDCRTYSSLGTDTQGHYRNDKEVEAGLLRNAAFTLSRGLQSYWCIPGEFYYDEPDVMKRIAQTTDVLDKLNEFPHRETRDAVAFVIDDESVMYENFTSNFQVMSVIWQRILGLAQCGVPYRVFLLSDLKNPNMPDYKTWLLPNMFKVDDDVMEMLRAKVLRNGNVAIFGPASGITDGETLSAEGASRLLGVPMELIPRTTVRHVIVQDFGHPITAELPAGMTYGDSRAFGPTLVPEEWAVENAGGQPLGHATTCWKLNRTGLFIKEEGLGAAGNGKPGDRGEGDYAVMWSVAMPIPPNLIRAAARYAGSNIWCEENDVIYASDSIVSIHSVKTGPRTIKLPRPATVTDAVTGEKLGDAMTEINIEIDPPETRIFTLE